MKPVNLMSAEAVVVDTATGSGPPLALIVGVAVGVAVLGGGGYMGMARVDTVKSETAKTAADQTEIQNQITALDAQIVQLGQTATTNQSQEAAKQAEGAIVSSFQQRLDYLTLLREIRGMMPNDPKAATVVGIQAGGSTDTSGGVPSSDSVAVVRMFARDEVVMAALVARMESAKSMKDVRITRTKSHREGGRFDAPQYFEFFVSATIDRGDAATGGSGGDSTVSSGGELGLALTAKPTHGKSSGTSNKPKPDKDAAPAKPVQPPNPFDTAAKRAGGGA